MGNYSVLCVKLCELCGKKIKESRIKLNNDVKILTGKRI